MSCSAEPGELNSTVYSIRYRCNTAHKRKIETSLSQELNELHTYLDNLSHNDADRHYSIIHSKG